MRPRVVAAAPGGGIDAVLAHCQTTIEAMLRAHGLVNDDGSTWASALVVWAPSTDVVHSNVRGASDGDAGERLALLSLDLTAPDG